MEWMLIWKTLEVSTRISKSCNLNKQYLLICYNASLSLIQDFLLRWGEGGGSGRRSKGKERKGSSV